MPKPMQYPKSHSMVGESEQLVQLLSQAMKDDIQTVTHEVLGASGRPFMHVELTPEERDEQYRMMREMDDPNVWIEQLQQAGSSTGRVLKNWREREQKWREEQGYGRDET